MATKYPSTNRTELLQVIAGGIGSVIATPYSTKSGAYNAVAGDRILVDTSAGPVSIALEATPSIGDNIEFVDAQGTFATHTFTATRNGQKINGATSDLTATTNNEAFKVIFAGGTIGWQVVRLQ